MNHTVTYTEVLLVGGSLTAEPSVPTAYITVVKSLSPPSDPGLFNLLIDGQNVAANVGNGGTSGKIQLDPGLHTVSETAGTGTSLADYASVIAGDVAQDGTIMLVAGDDKTAIIVNNRVQPGQVGSCRTLLHIWQHSVAAQPEIITDRAGDWTDCGSLGNKFFQGLKLDADTFGVSKILRIRDADSLTLHALQPEPQVHDGRQTIAYSFATPFLAHSVRDEPQDLVPWRRFGLEYVWEPSPESVQTWKTQFTAHGLSGYQHVARIETAYASVAPVTLALTSYDGTSPQVVTLPSTGGVYRKLLVTLTFNKGTLYQYAATSTGRFQLFLNDWIVWIGQHGRTGPYVAYRNLGGQVGDKARI
jgi:hypothetical protein